VTATEGTPRERAATVVFLLLLAAVGFAIAVLQFRNGTAWVLAVAPAVGALCWALGRLENGRAALLTPASHEYLLAATTLAVATCLAYVPTFAVPFNSDAIAYLHLFHAPSLSQFLRLFHSDLSQGAGGVNVQELRPVYGLSYMVSHFLWGLRPLGYHLGGILLHVLNALLVFRIALALAPGGRWRAWLAAALFALLPANAENLGSINGTLTEGLPTAFYLAAFLSFIRFRRTGLTRCLVAAAAAFAACLLSKETAVTLPVMLVCFDLFWTAAAKDAVAVGADQRGSRPRRSRLLAYVPFVLLLVTYLAMRRVAFPSLLKEDTWGRTWGGQGQEAGSALVGLVHQLGHLGRFWVSLQGFNLRSLVLPYPAAVLGVVLGLYLFWTWVVVQRRSECRRTIDVVVYLGLGWYLISTAPLLAVHASVGHLYLPSVGLCIAIAFLAAPACEDRGRPTGGYLRPSLAALLVGLSGLQLWQNNLAWGRTWAESLAPASQIAAASQDVPTTSLVVVWYTGAGVPAARVVEEYLPYALEAPFTSTDVYARLRIIEAPESYCCPLARWWTKSRAVVTAALAGSSGDSLEIVLLAWDWESRSFRRQRRVVAKGLLRARIDDALGEDGAAAASISRDSADRLMAALARLVEGGG
jgi:hypothetical protein